MDKASSIAQRAAAAAKIMANPQDYKICEGCESIVDAKIFICVNCHSFRFNSSKQSIIDHAKLLGSREQQSVTHEDMEC